MKTAALIIACLIGPLAFGLLLGGFAQLGTPKTGGRVSPKGTDPSTLLALLLDLVVLQGAISTLVLTRANWARMPEARRLIRFGGVCGLITLAAAYLAR
jgi:hypothetical protein